MSAPQGHRLFAAAYDWILAPAERLWLGALRRQLVGGLAGRVLEIGAGTGANLPYYPRDLELLVLSEPDPFMRRRLHQRAAAAGSLRVRVMDAPAEALPLAGEAFDAVVSSLVLCTVADPQQALAEVRRVVDPRGSLYMLEHVRAPTPGWARLQDVITPCWRRVAGGCHPNRDTAALVEAAGFRWTEGRLLLLGPWPVRPLWVGRAQPEQGF